MAKYKTELHCHSKDASGCSHESVEGIVEKYLAAGYTTIVLTNHFCPDSMDDDWMAKVAQKYDAYDKLVKAADGKLNILMGLEFRFTTNFNDYLVYGFDRKYLEDRPDILKQSIRDFIKTAREDGFLTIQAHPFRWGMTTVNPNDVDGIEVFNGHSNHNSNNDIAEMWAKKYNKIMTSGTDHHDPHHIPDGGILTDEPITSIPQLIETIRSGNYELIKDPIPPKPVKK